MKITLLAVSLYIVFLWWVNTSLGNKYIQSKKNQFYNIYKNTISIFFNISQISQNGFPPLAKYTPSFIVHCIVDIQQSVYWLLEFNINRNIPWDPHNMKKIYNLILCTYDRVHCVYIFATKNFLAGTLWYVYRMLRTFYHWIQSSWALESYSTYTCKGTCCLISQTMLKYRPAHNNSTPQLMNLNECLLCVIDRSLYPFDF